MTRIRDDFDATRRVAAPPTTWQAPYEAQDKTTEWKCDRLHDE